MQDEDKSKEQLIEELVELRRRNGELELEEAKHKQAEAEIRSAAAYNRGLIEASLDPMVTIDSGGKITDVNSATEGITGRTREELVGSDFADYFTESEKAREGCRQVFLTGIVRDYPLEIRHKKGKIIPVLYNASVYKDDSGNVIGVFAVARDITEGKRTEEELKERRHHLEELVEERTAELATANEQLQQEITEHKQAAEALRESEERLKTILDSMQTGVVITDAEEHTIVDLNPAAIEMIGAPKEQIVGHVCHKFMCPTEMGRCPVTDLGQTVDRSERVLINANGESVPILKTVILIILNGRKYLVESFLDITEHKRMEEELLKVEKLESISVLAGGIAHDLNNLLTGVMGNISLARLYEESVKKDERLAEAEKASMRIRGLTHQLLTFSKGGAPILQTAAIGDLLESSATFTLRGSNVRCEFSISDDLCAVAIDEGQMNQVINNLIINARQAMHDGGTVKIHAENMTIIEGYDLPLEPGAYIKVSVEDEGIGIPEEHIQKISDPFFSTKQTGSGLGLANAYYIIEKHNGYITVESQLGVGTIFHIYLPASPEGILIVEAEEEKKPIIGEGRILMMDDEDIIRELASDMLTNLGYEVITAVNSAEAIKLYRGAMESGRPFDAVILDLTVPGGMGGKESIQKLMEIAPDVKAIISSGYSNDPILANFREYGFKGAVAKPYEIRELSEILHRVTTGAIDMGVVISNHQ